MTDEIEGTVESIDLLPDVTVDELAAAFTEWHRRWVEEPDRYQSEAETMAGPSDDYGTGAARYLVAILVQRRGEIIDPVGLDPIGDPHGNVHQVGPSE